MNEIEQQTAVKLIKTLRLIRLGLVLGSAISVVVLLVLASVGKNTNFIFQMVALFFVVIGIIEYAFITSLINKKQTQLDSDRQK